jgi:hypothetical protein
MIHESCDGLESGDLCVDGRWDRLRMRVSGLHEDEYRGVDLTD